MKQSLMKLGLPRPTLTCLAAEAAAGALFERSFPSHLYLRYASPQRANYPMQKMTRSPSQSFFAIII
jgi:hypothetical protein